MKASEYARLINKAVKEYGDLDVCMTQSGYYADGIFAQLHAPQMQELDISDYDADVEVMVKYIVLGHSLQTY